MLKYVTKFTADILPSVVATIIGAYIVNHYIVAKPGAPGAAVVSSADPKQTNAKTEPKASAKPSASESVFVRSGVLSVAGRNVGATHHDFPFQDPDLGPSSNTHRAWLAPPRR